MISPKPVQSVYQFWRLVDYSELPFVLKQLGGIEERPLGKRVFYRSPRLETSIPIALTFLKGEDTVFLQNPGSLPSTGPHLSEISSNQVTELLAKWKCGDQQSLQALLPLVYSELRRLAQHHLRGERPDHTLQSTALVHEAYLRLVKPGSLQPESRRHFFALASQIMREILVDHARGRRAAKRDAGSRLTLDEAAELSKSKGVDLLALDDALNQLSEISPRQSRIVELKFFGGLSIDETSEFLGVSSATVERDWNAARAWLYREISRTEHRDA